MFFSFNFLFELLLSKNRWVFVMSVLGMVDLVTIVPVFVALSTEPVVKSPTGFVRLYRVLMLARVRIVHENRSHRMTAVVFSMMQWDARWRA